MGTQKLNLELKENTSEVYTIKVKDENGAYIDLQGDTIYFTVKTAYGVADASSTILKNVLVATGTPITEANIILDATDSKGKSSSSPFVYEIAWLPHTGGREVLYYGDYRINPQLRIN
jgi:hypothetical protein